MIGSVDIRLVHPFIYDPKKLDGSKSERISAPTLEEAFYPYIEHFFDFDEKNSDKIPCKLNVRERGLRTILFSDNRHRFEFMTLNDHNRAVENRAFGATVYFFRQNIALLVLAFNIPKEHYSSETDIPNLVQGISSFGFKKFSVERVFGRTDYYTDIDGIYESIGREKAYTIRPQENGKSRVRGWADPTEELSFDEKVTDAFRHNFEQSNNVQEIDVKQWVFEYIAPFVDGTGDKKLNPFNRSKMYAYMLFKCDNDLPKEFVESLLIQRKNLSNGHEFPEWIEHDHTRLSTAIYMRSNQQSVLIFGYDDNGGFMQKKFRPNYLNKYFLVYLITLYQKSVLENMIYDSSFIDYNKPDPSVMQKLKSDILQFYTNIDFTNISNNINRNLFYRSVRKSMRILDVRNEADNVIRRLTNEMDLIEKRKKEREREAADKKGRFWNIVFAVIGTLIAIASIPYKDF